MRILKQEKSKYFTLLSLYLAQSIPMSFFSTVVPVIMRLEHYSLESIGYLQLVKLPWILKFLWAPVVDASCGSRHQYRKWILGSEIFYALIILSIGFLNLQTDFVTIVVLMVIAFSASATQDIATDAFAILSLKKKERSLGNSMQSAGSFLGTMVGSGFLLIIYHHYGWNKLLLGLSGFVILALIPLVLYKTKGDSSGQSQRKKIVWIDFIHFFRQKGIWRHVVLLIFFYAGMIGILTMLKPYLVDLGYSVKKIGFMVGIFGTGVGALLTLPGGFLIRELGFRRMLFILLSVNFLVPLFFTLLTFTNHPIILVYIGIALLWTAYAVSSVFVYTLSMNMVRKGHEGADFTIQIVLTHLSSLAIATTSGKVADLLTYRGLFITELILGFIIAVVLILTFREKLYDREEYSAGND